MNPHQPKRTARLAGLFYLLVAITGAFGIMYIPTKIMVPSDALATVRNIIDNQFAFRLSIVSNMVSQTFFIVLGLALYRLLKEVDSKNARLMISLVLISVPIVFLNMLNQIIAFNLAQDNQVLVEFNRSQLNAMTMFFLNVSNDGIAIAQIFWGLWLLPFGLLVIKSGFIAKWIGYLLILACFAYLTNSAVHFLSPGRVSLVAPVTTIVGTVAEFAAILWLLIKGVRESKPATPEVVRK